MIDNLTFNIDIGYKYKILTTKSKEPGIQDIHKHNTMPGNIWIIYFDTIAMLKSISMIYQEIIKSFSIELILLIWIPTKAKC